MKKRFSVIVILSFCANSYSQNVGIGSSSFTPDAQAMLEIQSTTSGLLIPRMTSAQRTAISAGASSDYGLLVYQTDGTAGYYYWDGTVWQIISTGTSGWSLTGNASTVAGTNYLGTSDAVALVFKTNGTERMRFLSTGEAGINATPTTSYQLYVSTSTDGKRGIFGENTSTGTGAQYGLYGSKSGATGTGTGYGVYGTATASGTTNHGVYGSADGATNNYGTYGVTTTAGANAFGVYGVNNSTTGGSSHIAIKGETTSNCTGGTGYGLYGNGAGTSASANYGVYGTAGATPTSAYGVYGDAGTASNSYGTYGRSTGTGSNNYGVYGTKTGNAGGGVGYGVYGTATGTGANNYGGYFTSSGATINTGIYGIASGALGNNFGADISNTSTLAASTQYGIRATKTGNLGAGTGTGYGLSGSATGTGANNYGIYGYASDASTNNYGVYGSTNSTTNGVGVYGEANSVGTNVGVSAVASNGLGTNFAIRALSSGPSLSANYGVEAAVSGGPSNYGIYTAVTGATGGGFAGYFTNTQTTAGSVQYAIYASKTGNLGVGTGTGFGILSGVTGTGLNNYGIWTGAAGATNNYGLYVNTGETKITDAGGTLPTRTVDGSIATSTNGGNRIYFRTNATNYYVDASGTGDYSEYFRNSDATLSIGEIVCINMNDYNAVEKANYNTEGDNRMVGVVSKYGTRNNDDSEGQRSSDNNFVNVGLLGQLQVKISDENGPINPGDALALSITQPGIAVKAIEEGKIIGYAMTHYPYVPGEITYPTHAGTKKEKDTLNVPHVMAFIQPGFYKPRKSLIKP